MQLPPGPPGYRLITFFLFPKSMRNIIAPGPFVTAVCLSPRLFLLCVSISLNSNIIFLGWFFCNYSSISFCLCPLVTIKSLYFLYSIYCYLEFISIMFYFLWWHLLLECKFNDSWILTLYSQSSVQCLTFSGNLILIEWMSEKVVPKVTLFNSVLAFHLCISQGPTCSGHLSCRDDNSLRCFFAWSQPAQPWFLQGVLDTILIAVTWNPEWLWASQWSSFTVSCFSIGYCFQDCAPAWYSLCLRHGDRKSVLAKILFHMGKMPIWQPSANHWLSPLPNFLSSPNQVNYCLIDQKVPAVWGRQCHGTSLIGNACLWRAEQYNG